jgi:hypothetical protein
MQDFQVAIDLMNIKTESERKKVKNALFENLVVGSGSVNSNALLTENKFLNIKWDIVLEDQSSLSADISQIKILLKLRYLNLPTLQEKELELLFDEKAFDVS